MVNFALSKPISNDACETPRARRVCLHPYMFVCFSFQNDINVIYYRFCQMDKQIEITCFVTDVLCI